MVGVPLGGAHGDHQLTGNLGVRLARGDQPQHFELALAERLGEAGGAEGADGAGEGGGLHTTHCHGRQQAAHEPGRNGAHPRQEQRDIGRRFQEGADETRGRGEAHGPLQKGGASTNARSTVSARCTGAARLPCRICSAAFTAAISTATRSAPVCLAMGSGRPRRST